MEWNSFFYGGVIGSGAVFDIYTLLSECINGKYAYVRGHASGAAVGFGLAFTGGGGSITFEDGLSDINPNVFDGEYKKVSYGAALGGGVGGGIVQLGSAYSSFSGLALSLIGGIDLSIVGTAGRAWVVDQKLLIALVESKNDVCWHGDAFCRDNSLLR